MVGLIIKRQFARPAYRCCTANSLVPFLRALAFGVGSIRATACILEGIMTSHNIEKHLISCLAVRISCGRVAM